MEIFKKFHPHFFCIVISLRRFWAYLEPHYIVVMSLCFFWFLKADKNVSLSIFSLFKALYIAE